MAAGPRAGGFGTRRDQAALRGEQKGVELTFELLGAVIPFTLLVILATNKRLLDPALDRTSVKAAALLTRWGKLHGVLSRAGALAFALLLWHLAR